ncbi:MAG: hypothetical protein ACREDR_06105, partial [Blastocatellia bacterium]
KSIQRSGSFEEIGKAIPPFLRQVLGPAIATLMSFKGIVSIGYSHLVVMWSLIALAIALATVPASEMETGFIDLILSRPMARHWIILRSVIMVTGCTVALLILMIAGTWVGLNWLAPRDVEWPSAPLILSLAINLGLLVVCWGGIAMAIGAASRRRAAAGSITGLLALGTFLLDYVARQWRPAESISWASPFHYFSPFELLLGTGLRDRDVGVLGCTALVGFALAWLIFSRRDISH